MRGIKSLCPMHNSAVKETLIDQALQRARQSGIYIHNTSAIHKECLFRIAGQ